MTKKIKLTKSGVKVFAAVWQLLPKKLYSHTFIIVALTLVGTVLETVGIGLVIPAIALMADPNISENYPLLVPLFRYLGDPTHSQLVIYGVLLLLGFYIIKALFLAFLSWKQSKYIYDVKAYLSQSLFERYIRSPYEFHLRQNTGHLIRNITIEIEQLVSRILIPGVLLITELTVIVAIATLLFIIQPVGAAVLFAVMGLAMYGFQRVTQNHLKKWGTERQRHEGFRIQKAQEGLGGIKDVKLLGKEANFIDNYGKHTLNSALFERKQYALSNIPRLWLETIGVLGLTLLVIVTLKKNGSPAEVIPIIAFFAAAAFRVLPSANRILNSIQSLKYADAVIDLILKEFELKQDSTTSADTNIQLNDKIDFRSVSYEYPKAAMKSLSEITLSIKKGESIGLIGTSGAGKSTLVDVLLGLIRPTSGEVLVDDQNINESMRSWQNLIGYVQQSIFLTDDTLRRNIAFGLNDEQIDNVLVNQAIKAAQLEQFVLELPDGINTYLGERGVRLSGGQRQRIGIARALYDNPPVLVLDEATSALDSETESEVMESIKTLKGTRTMIIIAHRLSTIEHCDKIFQIDRGQIVKSFTPSSMRKMVPKP